VSIAIASLRTLPEVSHSASIVILSSQCRENPPKMTESATNAAKCVLVVEDEMLIGMLLEDMLVDLGHTVAAVVPRLKDALAAVENVPFDLAILDVHLHGESAFPVADALIARGIPFVFATGYGERGLPENYRDRPVLQKPFARGDLERVLNLAFG
jgi:CheY-like chemotaxis protein